MKIIKKNDLLKFSLNLLKKFVLICKILLIRNILRKIRGKPKDSLMCGPSDLDKACTYEIAEIIKITTFRYFIISLIDRGSGGGSSRRHAGL